MSAVHHVFLECLWEITACVLRFVAGAPVQCKRSVPHSLLAAVASCLEAQQRLCVMQVQLHISACSCRHSLQQDTFTGGLANAAQCWSEHMIASGAALA
jgi:hypothetical protein